MRTLKTTRADLKRWGRVLADLRQSEGWPSVNHIERIKQQAEVGLSPNGSTHLLKGSSGADYLPPWAITITQAVDEIANPAIRSAIVLFYVRLRVKRTELPKHVQAWLLDGERQVMMRLACVIEP